MLQNGNLTRLALSAANRQKAVAQFWRGDRGLRRAAQPLVLPRLSVARADGRPPRDARYAEVEGGEIIVRIPRRSLLKLSGAGAIAARTGGIAAILASGRAPAYGQASTVHYLRWSDFVPSSDQLLKTKIAPECEKALAIKLTLEMVNANDIQARITSAVQSGSGPDIIMVLNIWPQL